MIRKVVFSLTVVVLLVLLSIGKCQSQEWVPYVPPSQSVDLEFWMLDGFSYINVSIGFGDPCYEVDWGTVVREESEIWVNSTIWDFTGGCVDIPITFLHTYSLGSLEEGNYTFTFMAWNVTVKSINFRNPDTIPPAISILSPRNTTYPFPYEIPPIPIPLTFTVNETTSWIGYSLDGQANVTITGNTTLADLSFGTHSVIVYANDTTGNMGSSETVYFTVTMLGDINGDGIIDIMDLLIIALAFGSQPGDPRWNPDADINNDEIVDIMDAVILCVNFGETW